MKKNKLFTSVLAAGIALTSAFSVVGCGRPNPDGSHGDSGRADKPYDDTKTQVRISRRLTRILFTKRGKKACRSDMKAR